MAKRRFNAKKIANTPSLKKRMAKFIAQYDTEKQNYSLVEMLAFGHRGYISFSEKELCREFDKIYQLMLSKVESCKEDLNRPPDRAWQQAEKQRRLDEAIAEMADANEIANEIFEEQFL